jgi:hypothetical protein
MSVLQTLGFGSGLLFAMPSGGNQPTNPSPVQIGVLQNVKLTFSGDIKELNGQLQYAVDSAVGKRSIKGSFSFAQMTLNAWNNILFGELATTVGGRVLSYQEVGVIPATGPFTVTVAQSAHFLQDAEVKYSATGIALNPVPSAPASGQYSVSNGIYTFAAADEGATVLISYYYSATTGSTLTVNNHTMGWGPILSLDLTMPYQGYDKNILLPNVRISKLDLSTKQEDYTMTDSDFTAYAAPNGVVLQAYLPN